MSNMDSQWGDQQSNDGDSDKGDDLSGDAEGVWSSDIEQSFKEALAIYPPCGRRKIILGDEGKMYGRNELIARYIKVRTGKTRTRKQVSSHIQVLARRKTRELTSKLKDENTKQRALQSLQSMSSAQIVSAPEAKESASLPLSAEQQPTSGTTYPASGGGGGGGNPAYWPNRASTGGKPLIGETAFGFLVKPDPETAGPAATFLGTNKMRIVEFTAFMESRSPYDGQDSCKSRHYFVHLSPSVGEPVLEAVDIRQVYDKFLEMEGGLRDLYRKGPRDAFFLVKFWADLNTSMLEEGNAFYGHGAVYESTEDITIETSTKLCSFGKQVVDKRDTECPAFENGQYVYRLNNNPMCEYMINFIHRLKSLPEKYMMNSVLENFTVLHTVTNKSTSELILCVAFAFEVSSSEHGAQHNVYRLVSD